MTRQKQRWISSILFTTPLAGERAGDELSKQPKISKRTVLLQRLRDKRVKKQGIRKLNTSGSTCGKEEEEDKPRALECEPAEDREAQGGSTERPLKSMRKILENGKKRMSEDLISSKKKVRRVDIVPDEEVSERRLKRREQRRMRRARLKVVLSTV